MAISYEDFIKDGDKVVYAPTKKKKKKVSNYVAPTPAFAQMPKQVDTTKYVKPLSNMQVDLKTSVDVYRQRLRNEANKKNKKPFSIEKFGKGIGMEATAIGQGFLDKAEGVADLALRGASAVSGAFGNELLETSFKEAAQEDTTSKWLKYSKQAYKGGYVKEGDLMYGVGTAVGGIAADVGMTKLLPKKLQKLEVKIGNKKLNVPTAITLSAIGGGREDADKFKDANETQKWAYAVTGGVFEGLVENFFPSMGKWVDEARATKGLVDIDGVVNKLAGKMANKITKGMVKVGITSQTEGLEEDISALIQPVIKKMTVDPKTNVIEDWKNTDWLQVHMTGAITSALFQLPMASQIGADVESQIKAQMPKIQKARELTNKNGMPINAPKKAQEQTNVQTDINTQAAEKVSIVRPEMYNKADVTKTKQLFEKVAADRDGLSIKLDDSITSNGMYIKRADGTREISVNPNSPKSVEFVLVHELKHDMEGTPEYESLKKTILDYDKDIEGYAKAREDIANTYREVYAKQIVAENPTITAEELKTRVESMIDDEATSDILGTMLGDQNYINKLAVEQPNTFQKVMRWINDMLKRVTGKESKFLQDVKLKFEAAYRANNMSETGEKLSFFGNKIFEDKPDVMKLKRKAQEMESDKAGADVILQKTGFYYNDNIKQWVYELSDKEARIIIPPREDATYNLSEILKHDELYKFIPEYKDYKVIFKDLPKGHQGYIESGDKKIYINNSLIKDDFGLDEESYNQLSSLRAIKRLLEVETNPTKIAKAQDMMKEIESKIGKEKVKNYELKAKDFNTESEILDTLLHEIQHQNQDMSGLPQGSSIDYWLGQIIDQEKATVKKENTEIKKLLDAADSVWFETETPDKTRKHSELKQLATDKIMSALVEKGIIKEVDGAYGKDYKFTQETMKKAVKLYENTHGEIESRNVSDRFIESQKGDKKVKLPILANKNNDVSYVEPWLNTKTKMSDKNIDQDLTPEQREFFKDSKIRDEKGNLLKVYHGTNAEFNEFDTKMAGKNYGDWSRSGKGIYLTTERGLASYWADTANKNGSKSFIKELYVDIKNPFEVYESYDGKLKELQDKYNIPDSAMKAGYKIIKELNFNGFDSTEVLKEFGFDGIIDSQNSNNKEIVAFDSNQIKNIDNEAPTKSKDIRYSLPSKNSEAERTLIAQHNISDFKLKDLLELDGIPVPSIAITNHDQPLAEFGNITFLFDKSTIDPKNKKNEVYNRDIWSPRFPDVEYKVDTKGLDSVYTKLNEESGISYSRLERFTDILKRGGINNFDSYRDTFFDEVYFKINDIEQNTTNQIKYNDEINKWVKDTFGDYVLNKRIEKSGVDYLYSDGRRKPDSQLYLEYNLENIVKEMNKKDTVGSESTLGGTGFGQIQAAMATKFKSIEDIRNSKELITTKDKEAAIREQFSNNMYENIDKIAPYSNGYDAESMWSRSAALDNVSTAIYDTGRSGQVTIDNLKRNLQENLIDVTKVPDKVLTKVIADMVELKKLPTDYFEAKIKRAVPFNEVKKAIVKKGTSQNIIDGLTKKGIAIEYYTDENDRAAIISKASEGLRFSKNSEGKWEQRLDKVYAPIGIKNKVETKFRPKRVYTKKVAPVKEEPVAKMPQKKLPVAKTAEIITEEVKVTKAPIKQVSKKALGDTKIKQSRISNTLASVNKKQETQDIINSVDLAYGVKTNKGTIDRVMKDIDKNFTKEYERLIKAGEAFTTAEDTTKAGIIFKALVKKAETTGDVTQLLEFTKNVRPKATELGQTVQAFQTWKLETPEDAIWQTQKLIDSANKALEGKKMFGNRFEKLELNAKDIDFLLKKGKKIAKMQDGRAKDIEMALLKEHINQKIPAQLGKAFKGYIRTSILSSPSTGLTNMVANIINTIAEDVKKPIAGLTDIAVSQITGKRTTTVLPNLVAQGKGAKVGASRQVGDYFYGFNQEMKKLLKSGDIRNIDLINLFRSIDTSQEMSSTKDLTRGNNLGTQFKSKNPKVQAMLNLTFKKLEDTAKFFVRDDVFYEAFRTERLAELKKLNPKADIKDLEFEAEVYAGDQVFQGKAWDSENMQGSMVQRTTSLLGKIPVVGDIFMPLTRTGGNIGTRMLDYFPPTGFGKAMLQIGRAGFRDFDQKRFVDTVGRAGLGTVLWAIGYNLFKQGLLTPEYEKNKKIRALQDSTGYQPTSIKVGDMYLDIAKYQPISGIMLVGAEIAKRQEQNQEGLTGKVVYDGTLAGIDSIIKSTPFKGVENFQWSMQEKGVGGAVVDTILKAPSMLIPNLIKRPNASLDSLKRETYDVDSFREQFNTTISQVPIASTKLPSKLDIYGEAVTKREASVVSAMLNPFLISKDKKNDVSNELLKLYGQIGKTDFLPKVMPKSIQIQGKTVDLTTKEYQDYQRIIGTQVKKDLSYMFKTDTYKNLSAEEKAYAIKKVNEYAYSKAKEEVSNIMMDNQYSKLDGMNIGKFYLHKSKLRTITEESKGKEEGVKKQSVLSYLLDRQLNDKELTTLYQSAGYDKDLTPLNKAEIPVRYYLEVEKNIALLTSDDDPESDVEGKIINGSKKAKVLKVIQELPTTRRNKLMIYAMQGYSLDSSEKTEIFKNINSLPLTAADKRLILEEMDSFKWLEDGRLKGW